MQSYPHHNIFHEKIIEKFSLKNRLFLLIQFEFIHIQIKIQHPEYRCLYIGERVDLYDNTCCMVTRNTEIQSFAYSDR